METITVCYSFDWLKNVKIREEKCSKKITSGMKETYQAIVRCAYGKNFTWATIPGIAKITGLHPVTIWRNIRKLIAAGLIAKGFDEKSQKKGFYLLAHPELVAHMIKKGIKFVILKIELALRHGSRDVAGDEKQVQDEAVQGHKECESEAQENCILQSENCEMQSPLYRRKENEVPPLPPVEGKYKNHEPCMVVSEVEREGCVIENDEQLPPVVSTVLAEVDQERALIPLVALVKSSIIQVDGEKVQITAEKYSLKIIKRLLPLLEDAFNRHGITDVSLSVMSDEQQQRQEKKLLAKERQEKAKKLKQEQLATERITEAERKRVAGLPLEEQFGLLVQTYPQATSGYRDMRPWDYRPAWNVFENLHKTGKIPSVFDLLQAVKQQKKSTDWSRDNGRWIPGLWKWMSSNFSQYCPKV